MRAGEGGAPSPILRALPGRLAAALLVVTASLWTLWSVSSMFYQAWGLGALALLRALAPALATVAVGYLALAAPRIGGWMLTILGAAFTLLWWGLAISTGTFGLGWVIGTFPISGLFVAIGLLLLAEARHRRLRLAEGWEPPAQWWRRIPGRVAIVAFPALVAASVTLVYVPMITSRVDNGERGAAVIDGNGVRLEWAPAGPGWNARLPDGSYPSWNDLARYGVAPVGLTKDVAGGGPGAAAGGATSGEAPSGEAAPAASVPGTAGAAAAFAQNAAPDADAAAMAAKGLCTFLDDAGTALQDTPQGIWRLPTVEELTASLVTADGNAGCSWKAGDGVATCTTTPNKVTPLWAPDEPAIAYRTADDTGDARSWIVPYSGGGTWGGAIEAQPKSWRDPHVGFRCVREP